MLKTIATVSLALLVPCVVACSTESVDPMDEGSAGGKADDTEELACSLADDEAREITQFVLNDHVQFRCLGPVGFVETSCCAEQIADFTTASECPLQAKWSDASGSQRRCMEDDGSSEGGKFVPTACCTPLCDDGARWREQTNGTFCVTADGQFENSTCCMMKDAARCDGAGFDETIAADGRRHCRNGETGQFAPTGCCLDTCFEDMADNAGVEGYTVPFECLDAVTDECANAAVNAGGLCHDTDNGQFVKAACCAADLTSDDDRGRSDRASECELLNQDAIDCQTGDQAACITFDIASDGVDIEACCSLDRAAGSFEYCD